MARTTTLKRTAFGGILIAGLVSCLNSAAAESLQSYAATCAQKVGLDVEGFNCLDGFEVPMDGIAGGDCAKPPYLTSADCQRGSRLGVQLSNADPDIAIVWLCRKKFDQTGIGPDEFQDVAVIQTNFANGATCFYQQLGAKLDGRNVPPPRDGTFWLSPKEAMEEECASCHDTGLLRTPYLTQVVYPDGEKKGQKVLPTRRHRQNYWFPGEDFRDWNGKVRKIVDTQPLKNCTKCHPMGQNTIDPGFGTSTWLGLMATGVNNTPHLTPDPQTGQRAYWMSPTAQKDGRPRPEDEADAQRMAACARGILDYCYIEDWGGQLAATLEGLKNKAKPQLMQPGAGTTQD